MGTDEKCGKVRVYSVNFRHIDILMDAYGECSTMPIEWYRTDNSRRCDVPKYVRVLLYSLVRSHGQILCPMQERP